ncbi:MAG TPA: hypothetical protein VMH22_10985 [bacterium]|nr:hypothetical protein [bacterium]
MSRLRRFDIDFLGNSGPYVARQSPLEAADEKEAPYRRDWMSVPARDAARWCVY